MASHNVYTFFSVHNCLDEDFDATDAVADAELGRAIVAGRCGVHPDGWGNQNSLTAIMPLGFRKHEWTPFEPKPREVHLPVDLEWVAKHRRPPVEVADWPREPGWLRRARLRRERQFEWVPPTFAWTRPEPIEPAPPSGEVQLTCDECKALFRITMYYRGNRPAVVQSIRLLGKDEGWTCIAGTDRCPRCSLAAAPQAVGNGTGKDQGHKQHT